MSEPEEPSSVGQLAAFGVLGVCVAASIGWLLFANVRGHSEDEVEEDSDDDEYDSEEEFEMAVGRAFADETDCQAVIGDIVMRPDAKYEISVEELRDMLENEVPGQDFVLIDVREPHEHQQYNIGGEVCPISTIHQKIASLKDAAKLLPKKIILYCDSGNLSGQTTHLFIQEGISNVAHLAGGVEQWRRSFV